MFSSIRYVSNMLSQHELNGKCETATLPFLLIYIEHALCNIR